MLSHISRWVLKLYSSPASPLAPILAVSGYTEHNLEFFFIDNKYYDMKTELEMA